MDSFDFFCNVELDPCFFRYKLARTFQEPMCLALADRPDIELIPKRGGGFYLNYGGTWKYRSVTSEGGRFYIDFAPSYMTGSGRHYDPDGYQKELHEYQGFFVGHIFSDTLGYNISPSIPINRKKIVPVYQVRTEHLLKKMHDLQSTSGKLEFVWKNDGALRLM